MHSLLRIENAPVIDKKADEEVVDFIDKYVTGKVPSQDETLLDTVTCVLQHAKRHSETCKKNNTVCRFNFPKVPSPCTFIAHSPAEEDCKCGSKFQ